MQRFILVQFLSQISIQCLFNKKIKFIIFEANKKHMQVHSILLLYFSSLFQKKVLYEIKSLSICVTQEMMGEK